MPRLTKRVVESARPGDRAYIVWDSELAGFGLRVNISGRRTYILKYRVGGGRKGTVRKPTIGVHGAITAVEARAIARDWLGKVAKGGDPGAERKAARDAPTVSDLCGRFLEEHARPHKKPRSVAEDERNIRNHVRPLLGQRKVAEVTRADVDRAIAKVKSGHTGRDAKIGRHGGSILRGGPVGANRVLALLSVMFRLAERWELRPDYSNPCRHAHKYPERSRERFLTEAELGRLGDALAAAEADGSVSAPAIAGIRLLALTGCRVSEILSLRWEHVDLDRGVLRLPDSKTGSKVVHLAPPALAVLSALPCEPETHAYVIRGARAEQPLSALRGPWGRLRARAKLDGVRLHDLRHTAASVAVAAGLSLPIIGKMLGHTQAATTERYAHLAADPVRAAAATVAGTIDAAMRRAPSAEVLPLRGGGDQRP